MQHVNLGCKYATDFSYFCNERFSIAKTMQNLNPPHLQNQQWQIHTILCRFAWGNAVDLLLSYSHNKSYMQIPLQILHQNQHTIVFNENPLCGLYNLDFSDTHMRHLAESCHPAEKNCIITS